ncbi:GNAT family N-acetyltransferase [Bacillus sp. D-CC]
MANLLYPHFENHSFHKSDAPLKISLSFLSKYLSAFYSQPTKLPFGATYDGKVVGTVALLDIGNHQVALRKMFVKKEFRGKEWGASHKLLQTAILWAENKKLKDIYLGTTVKFLAAHRFYEKNGFQSVDIEDLPKSFPVLQVDKKFYRYIV